MIHTLSDNQDYHAITLQRTMDRQKDGRTKRGPWGTIPTD